MGATAATLGAILRVNGEKGSRAGGPGMWLGGFNACLGNVPSVAVVWEIEGLGSSPPSNSS